MVLVAALQAAAKVGGDGPRLALNALGMPAEVGLEVAEAAPPGACCQVASKPPKEQEKHENPAKSRWGGPGKFPRGPLAYGTPQKGPFRAGTKLFTSRKSRRAARPSGRRTLRYSSSLTKKARSKLGQFNLFRTLTSHGPLNFLIPMV